MVERSSTAGSSTTFAAAVPSAALRRRNFTVYSEELNGVRTAWHEAGRHFSVGVLRQYAFGLVHRTLAFRVHANERRAA